MLLNKAYYTFKFLLPRRLQIELRRYYVNRKRSQHADIWPIDPNAAQPREYGGIWGHDAASCPHIPQPDSHIPPTWPNAKKFSLVLTHDVETAEGLDKCYQLAEIEERLGFRSSFGFVPGDYPVPAALRQSLTDRGFALSGGQILNLSPMSAHFVKSVHQNIRNRK